MIASAEKTEFLRAPV